MADSAPRLYLVQARKDGNRRIHCRRVVTLIGSRPGCKVNLQHRSVTPLHVAIVNDGSQVLAVDLITRQGTLLNGLKMEHERLNDGDVLTIHPWEFRLDIKEPVHSGSADVHPFGLDPAPHVVALEHVITGRLLRLNRDVCVIGRRNGCDIVLADAGVSRIHALLLSYFGKPAVFDLLSTNHTYVNGAQVEFSLLNNDDTVTIGESRFRVRLMDSAVTERASKNNNGGTPAPASPQQDDHVNDLIDIRATESAQKWGIVENLEKATRKR